MFSNFESLASLDLTFLDTSHIIAMSSIYNLEIIFLIKS